MYYACKETGLSLKNQKKNILLLKEKLNILFTKAPQQKFILN